ncbi:aminotransferase class V-fold PLP-dependent enzyme [Amphiplicatus metriothermophilus]|uniref:Selenocysteine lyase/Cysteine desulfurase n=1 Tax=Amphiplicatus metriothermophilus TaxID=1519374 RepID=A0A239PV05_9PROT|nr:aminotransferase class V-fold PLP-dependent enzyme [Amphiplicatus metriothermophilus]MBB5519570.1 selenocysteine lyase/cysteine desulfurase [Amphiplicatus metriothermophilus]SNT74134.1 Selenocysteine lyase/Cysteine desulfurase [Amphiplicatus metriothermophilus]
MRLTRRNLLAAAGTAPLSGLARTARAQPPRALPDKDSFALSDVVYLDSGSQHPISLAAKTEIDAYFAKRMLDPAAAEYELDERGPIEKFARLVNADPAEIAYVQSTTAGEHIVVKSLGLPESGGRIVVDTLHFFGSLPLYEEMARRGATVAWVRAREGRIPLEDIRKAITPDTRLVSLSLVSTINGFEHDLKAVCDIAHEHGAYVYADIVHAAGCIPVDLRASGVDFAACATYKWLMGEFGLGFLYARKDVQPALKRVNSGYYGLGAFQSHIYPLDPPGERIVEYAFRDDATGLFAIGTRAHAVIAALNKSLDYILALEPTTIQAYVQPMIDRLKEELPRRGYDLMTPRESRTPLVAFALADARGTLGPSLKQARTSVTLSRNRFRISPSVFNDMDDIEHLLAALPRP